MTNGSVEMNNTMPGDDFRIGKYRLLELLSEGRYTDVWLAERIDIRKKVAIKILFPLVVRAGNARLLAKKLFFHEAQTLAQLTHPHIVQVFDYEKEEEHGWSYFVMEYAPFGSLADRYAPGERLSLSTVRSYTSQIGRAIHYIHTQGFIHRDIKPQNMFLKMRNSVVLGDFGLAMGFKGKHYPWLKMEFGGTRIYMAPEQEGGEPIPASDQYAYATVVFEWLTGYWPFYGDAKELAWQRRHLSPPLIRELVPEIPAAVERVVLTALDKSPNHRFKTMLDFTLEFEEACQSVHKGVYKIPARNLPGAITVDRNGTDARLTEIYCYQRTIGLVSQSDPVEQGDAIVATYPVATRYWKSEEDLWDSLFTSDGTRIRKVLTLRWQNLLRQARGVWERIAEFVWEGL
jgi:eukaryotic-like serine/threonine-protein kinase